MPNCWTIGSGSLEVEELEDEPPPAPPLLPVTASVPELQGGPAVLVNVRDPPPLVFTV
jgi:hypothetical protein